jgi:hypothetical protein
VVEQAPQLVNKLVQVSHLVPSLLRYCELGHAVHIAAPASLTRQAVQPVIFSVQLTQAVPAVSGTLVKTVSHKIHFEVPSAALVEHFVQDAMNELSHAIQDNLLAAGTFRPSVPH